MHAWLLLSTYVLVLEVDGWVSFDAQQIFEGRAGGVGKIVPGSLFTEKRERELMHCLLVL